MVLTAKKSAMIACVGSKGTSGIVLPLLDCGMYIRNVLVEAILYCMLYSYRMYNTVLRSVFEYGD